MPLEDFWGSGNVYGYIQPTKQSSNTGSLKIVAERMHTVLTSRLNQLNINLLGLYGGRPYIEARLSRFAGESDLSWKGGTRKKSQTKITGRKDQAHCVPHLGRIAEKISQYVLGIKPQREGITPEIENDITNDGESITQFMRTVNDFVTACRWCWIGVDAPANPTQEAVSQAQKAEGKIRPYWQVYAPTQVVDWYINPKGIVEWVLTESMDYQASDPLTEPKKVKYRRLWIPGQMSEFKYKKDDPSTIESQTDIPLTVNGNGGAAKLGVVPFLPVGKISAKPHGFDSLESSNRTIMDLESCNRQNFFNAVFPQRYMPISALDAVKENFQIDADAAVQLLVGECAPIFLGPDDQPPGFIMPDAAAIGKMREEIKELKYDMFEVVGLMLRQETRQVASADAKAWDFLDVEQVLRQRAEILETAERKAVELSRAWDGSFPEWTPKYNRAFEAGDFKAEMDAIVMAANVSMPSELQQYLLEKLYLRLKRLDSGAIEPELEKEILDAIKAFGGATAMVPI